MDPKLAEFNALLDSAYLSRLATKPTGCRELIEAFVTATPSLLDEMDQALRQQDKAMLNHLCHALSGASASVGAKMMAKTCQELANSQEWARQAALIDTLKDQFQKTHEALQTFLATLLPQTPIPTNGPRLKTVLIVEDNSIVRSALEVELSDCYRLLAAENSEMAFVFCESETIAAAIVDLNLGLSAEGVQYSGLDIIRYLKDKVPILVLTVDDRPETAEAALRAGAWMFLSKSTPLGLIRINLDILLARFEETNTRTFNNSLDIAIGIVMAQHYLSYDLAQRRIKQMASTQRRRIADIVEEILNAHVLHVGLRQIA